MAKAKVFPPMVTQMVAVGEETGRLDDMLSKVADFYDMEVENAVEALTALLEPIMVVGIGGIVGSVVIGMYLPIFTVINQLR
jgi:type IV pilus assembly protein PilC